MDKKYGPGEASWPGKLGGEAAGEDDVEGHGMGPQLRSVDDDVKDQDPGITRPPADDDEAVEGNVRGLSPR